MPVNTAEGTMASFGERAVGIDFNPSGDGTVHTIKVLYAQIIDILNDDRSQCGHGEKARHYSIAITEAETAQMRAVKAITFPE